MLHILLTIALSALSLLLTIRCWLLSIDPNYGIVNAARGLPWILNDRRQRSLILLDFDNFKAYNTLHGHSAADGRVRAALRLCRMPGVKVVKRGGDELLVSCYRRDVDAVLNLLRAAFATQQLTFTAAVVYTPTDKRRAMADAERAVLASKSAGVKAVTIAL